MKELHRYKENFLKHLDAMRGYSSHTLISYADAIDQMITEAEITDENDSLILNLMPLRLKIAPLKPKTIGAKLSAIRSFVKYLRKEGIMVELRGDESIKIPRSLPKPVSHEHILVALKGADPLCELAIVLLYGVGLRISELAGLRLEDVNDEWCRVEGKGGKERDVPLPATVREMIRSYHAHHPPNRYVLESGGKKLSENSLRYRIVKRFAEVGLKVTPHQLRHAYATELLNSGARIADVSELLGHSSMATTQIYTKLGNALKMDHYVKSHPLCQNREDPE